ncbi:MAG: DUF1805 domain-containing protein [Anaeroplasmataceae bacterium]|nr:DUF1805 domain-containing protein [Anaeroplasmataceae bacterium]
MEVLQNKLISEELTLNSLEIRLKGTTLLLLEGYGAFFMCGALDCTVYKEREVVCGRALGVKTIYELYNAEIRDVSSYALTKGIVPGMKVYEAFKKIRKEV